MKKIEDPYDKLLQNTREYPNNIPITKGKISEAFRRYFLIFKEI